MKTLEIANRKAWRRWLHAHHATVPEIWLVFRKGKPGPLSYSDALDEALCFGWIDSLVKRLDDRRYARKFTPRKADSRWSTVNRNRYARLRARGLVAKPGLQRSPTDRDGDAPRPPKGRPPRYIEAAFKRNPAAWKNFGKLAPSYRRHYVAWIDSAKRQETRNKRIKEAIGLLAAGKKLGLK